MFSCQGYDQLGIPCRLWALPGKNFCRYHQSHFEEEYKFLNLRKIPEARPETTSDSKMEVDSDLPPLISSSGSTTVSIVAEDPKKVPGIDSKKVECLFCTEEYIPEIFCYFCKQPLHRPCIIAWGKLVCPLCKKELTGSEGLKLTPEELKEMEKSRIQNIPDPISDLSQMDVLMDFIANLELQAENGNIEGPVQIIAMFLGIDPEGLQEDPDQN